MNSKKNIKIKRSKGRLYKKRKSTGRLVVETLILVVIVGGLVFLGYSIAGPLISRLSSGEGTSEISMWTPDENTLNNTETSSDTTPGESLTSTSDAPAASGIGSYLIPESALQNASTLAGALGTAKGAGFKIVLIPVKDTTGNVLYASNLPDIKDTDLITGTMPASQIASMAKAQGLTPKAILPTLMDAKSSVYVKDTGYYFADNSEISWLDNSAENGGKRWIDPFLDGTKKYYGDLTKELKTAGFEEVIISELRFPAFTDYDRDHCLLPRNFEADRYKALTAVYNSVYTASDKKAAVSVNISDVLEGSGKTFGSTAEILTDKSFSGTIYLTLNLSDFGDELKTGEDTSIKLPSDPVKKSETLIGKAVEYIGTNVTVVPVIKSDGLSIQQLEACYRNLNA